MKVLTVSDTHGYENIGKYLRKDVENRQLDVDLILLVGDLTNIPAYRSWLNTPEALRKRLADIELLLTTISKIKSTDGIAFLFGNDDFRELAGEVAKEDVEKSLKERFHAISLDFGYAKFEDYWFIGMGGSSPTPWKTPYEFSEEALYLEGTKLFEKVRELDRSAKIVLASHSPAKGVLDTVYNIGGNVSNEGSEAISKLVEKYAPRALVCGHIHEAYGTEMHEGTLVLNTASWHDNHNYGYVDLREDKVIATLYQIGVKKPISELTATRTVSPSVERFVNTKYLTH